eukprot:jgi/Bigna1/77167/fgenesh1_pg.46_\
MGSSAPSRCCLESPEADEMKKIDTIFSYFARSESSRYWEFEGFCDFEEVLLLNTDRKKIRSLWCKIVRYLESNANRDPKRSCRSIYGVNKLTLNFLNVLRKPNLPARSDLNPAFYRISAVDFSILIQMSQDPSFLEKLWSRFEKLLVHGRCAVDSSKDDQILSPSLDNLTSDLLLAMKKKQPPSRKRQPVNLKTISTRARSRGAKHGILKKNKVPSKINAEDIKEV